MNKAITPRKVHKQRARTLMKRGETVYWVKEDNSYLWHPKVWRSPK